ncbi:MAG: cadherin-like domain-containing protein, partial [Rhodospirillales bacterium]|nr:cadherin-like domain-containing protein [Rhodospirillales bacterium]
MTNSGTAAGNNDTSTGGTGGTGEIPRNPDGVPPVPPTSPPTTTPTAEVTLNVAAATGVEDAPGGIPLTIGASGGTGDTLGSVSISGVPAGATLSAGTFDAATGAWTLAPSDLAGLTITPPADYAGSFDLTVTAISTEGTATATKTASLHVDVTPVADAPSLVVNPSAGLEDTPIDLNISTAETDVDGSEVLFVTIGGLPAGASLSAGTNNGDGTWTLTTGDLVGLQLNPPANFNGDITLSVVSTSTDALGVITDSASTGGGLTVTIAPVGDAVDISVQPASGTEDSAVALNIVAAASGGETIASVTISGVPTGATLSAGTDNGNGTWTLNSGQLTGLTMTPPADFSGSFNLAITATSSEGGVNSANMGVDITPVADAPTLTAAAASGAEDTAIALNIATAETDADGSETLSVTIG